jgi:hypothetical protein
MANAAGLVHHGPMKRYGAVAAVSGCALVVAGWIVYLVTVGLDRADKLSSVVGAILAAVFGTAGLVIAYRTWRSSPSGGDAPPAAPIQINQASGNATVQGVQGGNLIVGDPGPPDGP